MSPPREALCKFPDSGSCCGIAVAIYYYCGGLRSREGKRRLPAEISSIKVRLLEQGTLYEPSIPYLILYIVLKNFEWK